VGALGISKVQYPAYFGYLKESEAELLRIGRTKCNYLRDPSQLSAVIFLLMRAASLFRSVLSILQSGQLDACDAVRRAYLETWLLAFEFRLQEGFLPRIVLGKPQLVRNGHSLELINDLNVLLLGGHGRYSRLAKLRLLFREVWSTYRKCLGKVCIYFSS
jgi:hypothetical protein